MILALVQSLLNPSLEIRRCGPHLATVTRRRWPAIIVAGSWSFEVGDELLRDVGGFKGGSDRGALVQTGQPHLVRLDYPDSWVAAVPGSADGVNPGTVIDVAYVRFWFPAVAGRWRQGRICDRLERRARSEHGECSMVLNPGRRLRVASCVVMPA